MYILDIHNIYIYILLIYFYYALSLICIIKTDEILISIIEEV